LGSLQDDQLMAQGDDLSRHSDASPKANEEGIEQHQYKVEHSGKKATRLGRNSNNSNTDLGRTIQLTQVTPRRAVPQAHAPS
jgi:hypothetical protein